MRDTSLSSMVDTSRALRTGSTARRMSSSPPSFRAQPSPTLRPSIPTTRRRGTSSSSTASSPAREGPTSTWNLERGKHVRFWKNEEFRWGYILHRKEKYAVHTFLLFLLFCYLNFFLIRSFRLRIFQIFTVNSAKSANIENYALKTINI